MNKLKYVFSLLLVWLPASHWDGNKFRFIRVRAAKLALAFAARTLERLNITSSIRLEESGNNLINLNGVWLSLAASNRYLKKQFSERANEGSEMLWFRREMGIEHIEAMVDIGANVGEVSLFFAKEFPKSRVICVEPAPRNIDWFEKHCSYQDFPVRNVELYRYAISDKSDQIVKMYGYNAQSSLVPYAPESAEVKTITLSDFWVEAELESVDFVKIDIEGSEPLLEESIRDLAGFSRSWLVELGPKAPREAYRGLFEAFFSKGFVAFQRSTKRKFMTLDTALEFFLNEIENQTEDVWFISQSQLAD